MPNSTDPWLVRAKAVLIGSQLPSAQIQFAVSLLTEVYGPQSPQLIAYNAMLAQIAKSVTNVLALPSYQQQCAQGVIQNVIAEIEAGLTSSLRTQVAGEIFAELVGLGKEVLADDTDPAKNVSAVLIAAAFEDLIRRMGSETAGVEGRPKLEQVIIALKDAGVLKGGEVGTAQSYLKFRNDSLHANWANVEKPVVQSCIAFIEALLVKHFS
jgi:hypothetical protein